MDTGLGFGILRRSTSTVINGVISVSDTVLKLNCYTGGIVESDKSSMTGDSITITVTDGSGATITFAGTVTATSMSGVYSATGISVTTCTNGGTAVTADSGTWSLTKV